ncbi:Fur family transcriptional regulator [Paenibacillus apiarius]|uniref:Transcriptional repressor n=1 Tax=Paenibacillus apiarius TaxID=46240 RepID=A0ABT4DU82_9BACL|nr:transcriptional repressor [Paenibacillus apiarius]MBN3526949.1 transcriptional repressor [Paenibacillus apiarius]MCY9516331.1 transcriptional repressor [Paenibacillus apiarius]MCY9519571.1 transcriptional repressor [Paenibacillus apiarius]MCY9554667.1 transcriptional repressor [Paenibacillus apiarius]MCY9561506.1 transcriptional repressor [Paenibacillus apiarius]
MARKGMLTTPRKTIYDIVSHSSDHPTASDVMDRLKERGYSFAYATVYNSLRYLTKEGLIRELKLEGDASRYDARTDDHQHVVCVKCGRVEEVCIATPKEWLERIAEETGFAIAEEEFLFKGVCAACSDSKKTTQ